MCNRYAIDNLFVIENRIIVEYWESNFIEEESLESLEFELSEYILE